MVALKQPLGSLAAGREPERTRADSLHFPAATVPALRLRVDPAHCSIQRLRYRRYIR